MNENKRMATPKQEQCLGCSLMDACKDAVGLYGDKTECIKTKLGIESQYEDVVHESEWDFLTL